MTPPPTASMATRSAARTRCMNTGPSACLRRRPSLWCSSWGEHLLKADLRIAQFGGAHCCVAKGPLGSRYGAQQVRCVTGKGRYRPFMSTQLLVQRFGTQSPFPVMRAALNGGARYPADGDGVEILNDVAPALAAAVATVGLAARRGSGAGVWRFLKEAVRYREHVRAEQERHAGLAALLERLPPGSRLVVRQEPGGRHSMEVRTERRPSPPDQCNAP